MPGLLGETARRGKEKDRDLVRGIPKILAKAGYAIVKVNSKRRLLAAFQTDERPYALAHSPEKEFLIIGDALGLVHFLRPEGIK
jgi:hypothetical protein